MALKRTSVIHPNFIIGLISYFLFLLGVVLTASNLEAGRTLIMTAIVMGVFHWIRSLVDVWTDPGLKTQEARRYFWFSLVIMIPPLAGMWYYIVHQKKVSL